MHEIYESKGKYNLEYNIPKILYSSLISMILNKILTLLALSNDDILNFKQTKNNQRRRQLLFSCFSINVFF